MMNDLDIKNKRILLFDFDGTLIETASGNTFATDLTDMRIKMDVVNKALDLMQENGVKVFAIVSNQGGVEAGFVSGADIEAKIEYVLRSVHDLAVKRGIRGVLYEKRLCYSNDEQNPMRKPNTGMIDDILMKCKDTVMRGMNFSQLKGCSLMVGDASGLPGQFSDSDKVCAEKAGVDYMDVIQFLGKDLDLEYVLSKEHTSEGIILNNDHIYILENPYGVGLNIKITLKDFYKIETDDGKTATVDDVLNIRIDKDQNFNLYSDVIKIETLKDGSIKYTSLYHESKENSDSLS
jgi:DNA 3'-phosphatase